jgi:Rod binding domain-containing protein
MSVQFDRSAWPAPLASNQTSPKTVSSHGINDPLRSAAQALEVSFLTEMLKSAGLGKTRDAFGGGAGEDQFSSFLVRAQAEQMVKSGGIGLAEVIFESLKKGQSDG